ncbi:alkaline phosphatase [Gilvimarinus polysaccharolyticus]|uniref:alkaline phosphatase n=1 Tax=Gilvimarinus polysaccharolyticus TaxID=863921 RepID=UPI0006734F00|nr:alkaline phosphatase [Gilvimarinus polysaccharolyticus]
MKQTLAATALLFITQVASAATAQQVAPQSIIYVIGDGMGMEYITAYRHFVDDPATEEIEETLFDRYFVGTSATHPHGHELVTDSAAGATALSAAIKTYNGAIGVDIDKQPVETLLERAKTLGYSTAMVTTSQINHATPASFAAHIDSRQKYDEIADQYLDNRIAGKPWVDVLIGGGEKYFKREDRDLVAGFTALGYQYADSFALLDRIEAAPALALLADKGLPFAIDAPPANRLAVMTSKALALLPKNKPFFLLVEASEIDWCGHANDIACAMGEMHDAEQTLGVVSRYVSEHNNTVMVMTADHSTGGLSMGANGEYEWRASVVRGVKASAGELARELKEAGNTWPVKWQELTGITLSAEQQDTMAKQVKASVIANTEAEKNSAKTTLRSGILAAINTASATGWTTGGHTGGDVGVFAAGVNPEQFAGHQDNTAIALKLFTRLRPVQ